MTSYHDLNPDNLNEAQIDALSNTSASQYDIICINHNLIEQRKSLQSVVSALRNLNDNMDKALYAEVRNGKVEKRLIGELIAEIYDREKMSRDIEAFFSIARHYKKWFYLLFIFFILINMKWGNDVLNFFNFLGSKLTSVIKYLF
jgi:uncharacterized coiled-coil protein SlyX